MNLGQHIVTGALRIYKFAISPALHVIVGPLGGCRFHPTCSAYASEAVQVHGVIKGSVLAAGRICRCHPWGGCGHDPVPDRKRPEVLRSKLSEPRPDFGAQSTS